MARNGPAQEDRKREARKAGKKQLGEARGGGVKLSRRREEMKGGRI